MSESCRIMLQISKGQFCYLWAKGAVAGKVVAVAKVVEDLEPDDNIIWRSCFAMMDWILVVRSGESGVSTAVERPCAAESLSVGDMEVDQGVESGPFGKSRNQKELKFWQTDPLWWNRKELKFWRTDPLWELKFWLTDLYDGQLDMGSFVEIWSGVGPA